MSCRVASLGIETWQLALILFKTKVVESQRPAILGDIAHELVRGVLRKLGLNVEGDLNIDSYDAGKMLDDLLRDAGSITAQATGIESHGTVETSKLRGTRSDGSRCRSYGTGGLGCRNRAWSAPRLRLRPVRGEGFRLTP